MLKNSLFPILGLMLILAACSRKQPILLLTSLESKNKISDLTRKLASQNQNQCLGDVFNIETLKAEVKEKEEALQSESVKGNWRHLDLSTLPTAAGNFLKTHGNAIGDLEKDSIDYSSCQDIPCIYNQIYKKGDHVAGYVHYLWYLRFGSMLSADNLAPVQNVELPGRYNGQYFPLSSYLYNDQELYALWRLSLMVDSPHTTLTNLHEVQRMPRGQKFESPYQGACGLANSKGFIMLVDGCLAAKDDGGYIYPAVLHELTHMVDFEEGKIRFGQFYRSQQKDYLEIIGYTKEEYRDAAGTVFIKWKVSDPSKLITPYSANNPQENFAELLSQYRMQGDTTKQKAAADHYQVAYEQYFQQREFTKVSRMEDWSRKELAGSSQLALKQVINCLKQNSPDLCLNLQKPELINEITAKAKMKYPEACVAFKEPKSFLDWKTIVGNRIQKVYKRFSSLNQYPKALEYLDENFESTFAPTLAYASYLKCPEGDEDCYQQKIRQDSLLNDVAELNDSQESLHKIYLTSYPYQEVQNEVKRFYSMLIGSYQGVIRTKVNEAWSKCIQNPNDNSPPRSGEFVIEDGYLMSSVFNCVNTEFPFVLSSSLKSLKLKGLGLKDEDEKSHVMGLMKAQVLKSFKEKYLAEKQNETETAEYFAATSVQRVKNILLANRYWTRRSRDPKELSRLCTDVAYQVVGMKPVCHLKKELFKDFVERQVCGNIASEL